MANTAFIEKDNGKMRPIMRDFAKLLPTVRKDLRVALFEKPKICNGFFFNMYLDG